jgi:hypothetical protein
VKLDVWRDNLPLQSQNGLDEAAQASSCLAMADIGFDLVFASASPGLCRGIEWDKVYTSNVSIFSFYILATKDTCNSCEFQRIPSLCSCAVTLFMN